MATDPLDFGLKLSDVRARAEAMRYFLSVTGILEAAEALDESLGVSARPPAAFVAVSGEEAEPSKLIGRHQQRVNFVVTILFVESASRADRKASDQLDNVRRATIRQFIGWKPDGTAKPLDYMGFRVVSIGNGLAWGECRFGGSYFVGTDV